MTRFLIQRIQTGPTWILVVTAGILTGLSTPGRHTQLVGMIACFPLFLVFDRIHQNAAISWKKKCWFLWLACAGTGSLMAVLGTPGFTHSIHVFGHFPWIVAYLITGLVYGCEVALILMIEFGLPLLVIRRRGWWDLLVRLAYFLMLEPLYPSFFRWSFGGFTFVNFPLLPQLADIVGSSGLGFYNIGFSFLLLLLWRWKVEHLPIPRHILQRLAGGYVIFWLLGLGYGAWKNISLSAKLEDGPQMHVAAIQPNFSLERLASNPKLAYSSRERNLTNLLRDSVKAVKTFPKDSLLPKLVIWPESTYPDAFLKDRHSRQRVEGFARTYNTYVLFSSLDWEKTPSRTRYFGVSFLIDPQGTLIGYYDKIFLIPFGEYIPEIPFFPYPANWLRENVQNISEFERGREYTVFELTKEHHFAAPICFDAFSPTIIQNMVKNGAEFVILLSNLAWFGKTNAVDLMEMSLRWHAIENRIPALQISNNGRTVLMNALGQPAKAHIELFTEGVLTETVTLQKHFSIYRDYRIVVQGTFAFILAVLAFLGQRRGRIFS